MTLGEEEGGIIEKGGRVGGRSLKEVGEERGERSEEGDGGMKGVMQSC